MIKILQAIKEELETGTIDVKKASKLTKDIGKWLEAEELKLKAEEHKLNA
jgi:hypothetical protein